MKSKLWILITTLILASMVLVSCAAPTAEKIIETVVVEKEKTVVETVVSEVEVEKMVEVTAVPTPKGVVTVTIFVGFGTGTNAPQIEVHKQLQDLYNSTHTDIQIEFLTVPWEERLTKYGTLLAADQVPDIAMPIGVGGIASQYKGWLDITPYVEADSYDLTRFVGLTPKIHNYPGQGLLGLPMCVYPAAIYYNADIFDAAGVDYPPAKHGEPYADGEPWTYDKMVEIAKKLTLDANGNDANSPAFDPENIVQFGWNGWDWMSHAFEWAAKWGDAPGTGVSDDGTKSLFNTPQFVDFAKFHKDTIWTWHIRANGEQSGLFYQAAGDPMGSGMVAMWEIHSWMGFAYPTWSEKFNWNVAAVPEGPNGRIVALMDADTAVIPAGAKNPNEAWEVMKWFYEQEQYEVLIKNYTCTPADQESLANWVTNMKADYPGVNFDVFVEAMDYAEAVNHESFKGNYNKINDEENNVNSAIMSGENLDVDAMMQTLHETVQQLLDDYWTVYYRDLSGD